MVLGGSDKSVERVCHAALDDAGKDEFENLAAPPGREGRISAELNARRRLIKSGGSKPILHPEREGEIGVKLENMVVLADSVDNDLNEKPATMHRCTESNTLARRCKAWRCD